MNARKNKILEKMREGRKAYGFGLSFPCEDVVEYVGAAGLDFIHFDAEHGPFVPESIDRLCRVADSYGLATTARVPSSDAAVVNRFLDRGIVGIMIPHVNNGAEAKAAVMACRFAPDGARSWGTGRGTHWGLQPNEDKPAYMAETNRNMLVMVQLETAEALERLPEILDVKGVDLYAFGPNDLAASMGYPGRPDHPTVVAAMKKTTGAIHQAGKRMMSDVMVSLRATNVLFKAASDLAKSAAGESA